MRESLRARSGPRKRCNPVCDMEGTAYICVTCYVSRTVVSRRMCHVSCKITVLFITHDTLNITQRKLPAFNAALDDAAGQVGPGARQGGGFRFVTGPGGEIRRVAG